MLKYIGKRLLLMIPVIWGISLLVFALLDLSPGDAAEIILGTKATPEALAALRAEMGLDQPFWVRYFTYIGNAIQGDFGTSWRTKLSVVDELMARLPQTMTLALGSMILTILVGLPIGVISAVKQYSALDNITQVGALVLSSVPGFWLGTMMILFFSLKLHWFPATGAGSIRGYILPWITMAATSVASLVRMTRSSMLDVIGADYIKMARAKGCTEKQVILRHSLRNALLPIITVIGMDFAGLIGGTVITENVFTIPGLGSLAVTSLRQLDVPMVMGEVLFIAIAVGLTNLVVDVLYVYIDPRLKSQYVTKRRKKEE